MGKGKTFKTTIEINGNLDPSVKAAIEKAVAAVDDMSDEVLATASAAAKLTLQMDKQEAAIKAAQEQYASYVLEGKKGSKQAKELAKSIEAMDKELSQNKDALKAAEKAAEQLAPSLDDVSDAAEDSKGGFSVMKGAMSDLVADGISGLIDWCADAAQSIYGLAEETREYREDINKLDTAFESAGHNAEMASDTYNTLYGVIGETDQSVEAAQQIALLADSEKDAARWAGYAAGVVGRFGDALQPETFYESANETFKLNEATGAYTQMLEGAGYSVEDFNKYLELCTTDAEKQAYMLAVTDQILGDASDSYREANDSIIAARESQAEFTDITAQMGEKIEPVTTAVQGEFNEILGAALELMDQIDFSAIAEQVGNLTEDCIELAQNGIAWLKDNADWLIPVLSGLTAGFVAFKVAVGISSIVSKLTTAMNGMTFAQYALTTAQNLLNKAMNMNPIMKIVALITILVGAGVWLYKNWDTVKEKALELGAKVGEIWDNISGWISGAIDSIGAKFPLFGAYLDGWWSSIQAAVENVKNIFKGVIDFVSNVFAGNWSGAWDNVVQIFGDTFSMLGNLVKAPLNAVISLVNKAIGAINNINVKIPDWAGGGELGFNIPEIPMLATGGFTNGVSIAGEAGTEAVISFDPRYRAQNLGYWTEAGRMLGADVSTLEQGGIVSGSSIDFGGVTFAPNITITGNASKSDVLEAIREAEPEFMDMLEELIQRRREPVYA